MEKRQEEAFWDTIKVFEELGILEHIMIIGSWAEYLFPPLFESDFIPNIRTRDVDFFYRNINIPKEKVPLIERLKEYGFTYSEDPYRDVSKFYKEELLELEFLTRVMGKGSRTTYNISALGIKSEGLRDINILSDYACEIECRGYKLIIPEPSVYVMQKILTNPHRVPPTKKKKDIYAIKEILVHIHQSENHMEKLREIYSLLTKKQIVIVEKVIKEERIDLFAED